MGGGGLQVGALRRGQPAGFGDFGKTFWAGEVEGEYLVREEAGGVCRDRAGARQTERYLCYRVGEVLKSQESVVSQNDKAFTGSIPDIYDEYLVPMIFESYAKDLAARVVARPVEDVLETAAGSGVLTRALAPMLSQEARLVVTDLNQPMLDRATQRQPHNDTIVWQQSDALNLPFEEDSFDAVCCQFGVMFFPDKRRGYAEALRVLRPGGRFLFNVWDRIEHNVFADIVTRVATGFLPDKPPQFLARTPHGYSDPEVIRHDLEAAGFSDISFEMITDTSTAAEASHPAIAYVQGTPLRGEVEPFGDDLLQKVTEAATREIEAQFGSGPVSAKIQGLVVTAS
jgi:ubiquinone/menaquinone biosynthesis C-methylase UbiE